MVHERFSNKQTATMGSQVDILVHASQRMGLVEHSVAHIDGPYMKLWASTEVAGAVITALQLYSVFKEISFIIIMHARVPANAILRFLQFPAASGHQWVQEDMRHYVYVYVICVCVRLTLLPELPHLMKCHCLCSGVSSMSIMQYFRCIFILCFIGPKM